MILALHGNLGTPEVWDLVRARLPEEEVFVAPCLWDGPILSLADAGRRLNREARESGSVLLGYSLGARIAMHALVAKGARWSGAIFVSGHPGLEDRAARQARCRADEVWARRFAREEPEAALDAWNRQPVFAGTESAADQAAVLDAHRTRIVRAFRRWSLGRQENLVPQLAACGVPTLWIAGSEDAGFVALAHRAVSGIPGATYAIMEGCGHRVPLQKPEALAEYVRRFLGGLCRLPPADLSNPEP